MGSVQKDKEVVTSAVSSDNLEIPLVDFSAFVSGDEETKRDTAKAILSGFQSAGFIYLRNHGIDKATVQRTFAESARFFKRPQGQKDRLAWTTPEANRGYAAIGREKVTDYADEDDVDRLRAEEGEDLKETMDIGREGDGHENHWPDGVDGEGEPFRRQMLDFFERCQGVHAEIMRAIAVGLGIDRTWFDGFCDAGDNTLRLLHYPEVSAEVFRKNRLQVRAGAHTDYGSITLLFQVSRWCWWGMSNGDAAAHRVGRRTWPEGCRCSPRTATSSTRLRSRTRSWSTRATCWRGGRTTRSRARSTGWSSRGDRRRMTFIR